jgi:uncharacterized protein (DUF3084 family)
VRAVSELQDNKKQLENQVRNLREAEKELDKVRVERDESKKEILRLNNALRSASEQSDNAEKRVINLQK